jgi:peptidoglycan/xylan/chitin deacetylase (PgdA/CDA1 family)
MPGQQEHALSTALPILMYHYLGDHPPADDRPWTISPRRFRRQLHWLRAQGFQALTLDAALAVLCDGAEMPERACWLSFDDGHVSCHALAAPILAEFGWTASFFIITDRVGRAGYLDWAQCRELAEAGFAIQSHGTAHAKLTGIAPEAAEQEITISKQEIEQRVGRPVLAYAYRGGHYNASVQAQVQAAGYRCALSCRAGANDRDTDLYALRRYAIKEADGWLALQRRLGRYTGRGRINSLLRPFLVRDAP